MQYMSLYMHEVMLESCNEQGIYPNDKSISNYSLIFNENDNNVTFQEIVSDN